MARPTASSGVAALAAMTCLARASVARADASPADQALAQSLFDEARGLVAAGDYPRACPKFAESERLDPGGGTLLNLALCHEHEGKTATAWTEFNEALSRAIHDGRPEREARAREQIAALAPRLSHLTVRVATGAPGDVRITVDGAAWNDAMRGVPVPMDPGPHVVVAQAPARPAWSTTVTLGSSADAQTVVVHVPEAAASPGSAERSSALPAASGGGWRTAGLVAGGLGVTGIAVGAIAGGLAIATWNQQESDCASPTRCPDRSAAESDHARLVNEGTLSNVAFVAGGVLLAGGALLFLTAPTPSPASAGLSVAPAVGPRLAALGVQGSF